MRNSVTLAAAALLLGIATASGAEPILEGIPAAPRDPIAYRAMAVDARTALDAGRLDEAVRLYQAVTAQYPVDGFNWRRLGDALRRLGRDEEAIAAYARSVALSGPAVGSARYWIAALQAKLGRRAEALETLRVMVETDHEIDRPGLLGDPAFASFAGDPAFRALTAPLTATGTDRVAGWRGDLAHLVAELHRLHPPLRGRDLRLDMATAVAALDRDIPTLSDEQVFARMAQIVAMLRQNHTNLWGGPPSAIVGAEPILPLGLLPVQSYLFPDGLYIVGADSAHADLVGRKVEAIGAVPIAEALRLVRSTLSFGSEAEFAWTAPARLATQPLLVGLGLAERGKPVRVHFAPVRGKPAWADLVGVPAMPALHLPAPPKVPAPQFLARSTEPLWFQPEPDGRTVYVQFNRVQNGEKDTLASLAGSLRTALEAPGIDSVIVDLRHNNGGNTFLYPELIRVLVGFSVRPGAQVYALIGRDVYSAAGNFSTDLERFASPVFVGEPTGNFGNQGGDEGRILLPYSHLTGTIAAVEWQLSHPWDRRGTILPQVPVDLTAVDYFAGRDPVLETARKLIAARKR